jgi:hypothetical protein
MSNPPLSFPDFPASPLGGAPGSAGQRAQHDGPRLRLVVFPRRGAERPERVSVRVLPRDRALLTDGVRHRGLTASQAWRWHFPNAGTVLPARNRLSELAAARLFVHVPRAKAQEGLYVPTHAGARFGQTDLKAPTVPRHDQLGKIGHDLTVAEVAHWLPDRSVPGVSWLTWRELSREAALKLPAEQRRGRASIGELPDGALVMPQGERLAVEVELSDKRWRLGDKLSWYRRMLQIDAYRSVAWFTHKAAIAGGLVDRLSREGFTEDEMWVELLPPDVRVWVE